jgi:hypothetical protein
MTTDSRGVKASAMTFSHDQDPERTFEACRSCGTLQEKPKLQGNQTLPAIEGGEGPWQTLTIATKLRDLSR